MEKKNNPSTQKKDGKDLKKKAASTQPDIPAKNNIYKKNGTPQPETKESSFEPDYDDYSDLDDDDEPVDYEEDNE